ncbi:hypothetical protein ACI2L1_04470 [Streptomyces sp. NPDC019531]|uniref:hypothetical protein n=1 Tax=Streptomyces sp. NPDC019531 TaxID=3365062 RepID=UPI0038510309
MRSARMILATAAASTVLALGAPGAWAAGDDWDQADSSHSKEHGKEHGKGSDHDSPHGGMHTGGGALTAVNGKEKDDGWSGHHDKPSGGMHTGGGALTAVNADDWGTAKDPKADPETYKDHSGKQKDGGWSGHHDKPSGGMHTGGGALASPGMTTGGLAVLAVAGTGLYAARRKKTAVSVA